MYPKVTKLIDAIDDVFTSKAWEPQGQITFCNLAVKDVCQRLGYSRFDNMLANDMVNYMEYSDEWKEVTADIAYMAASVGYIVLAALKSSPHGHIVVIRPGEKVHTKKWNKKVPKCMNIGKSYQLNIGVNWAFGGEEPKYYVLLNLPVISVGGDSEKDSEKDS